MSILLPSLNLLIAAVKERTIQSHTAAYLRGGGHWVITPSSPLPWRDATFCLYCLSNAKIGQLIPSKIVYYNCCHQMSDFKDYSAPQTRWI